MEDTENMNTESNVPGGDTSSSGGASESNPSQQAATEQNASSQSEAQGTVSYETHRRLLAEKKKADELVRSFADKEKKRAEDEARQKEDWKTLLAAREKELEEERSKHSSLRDRLNSGAKLRAVLEGINGTVDQEFFGLIPVDKVVLDPETGLPDPMTVKDAVKLFESKYSKVISPKEVKLPPSQAAKAGTSSFEDEIKGAKTQADLDRVMKKYNKV